MEITSVNAAVKKNITAVPSAEDMTAVKKTGFVPDDRKNADELELSEDYLRYAEDKDGDGEISEEEAEAEEISDGKKPEDEDKKAEEEKDEDKEESGRTTVSVNVEKRRRQIAAAQNRSDLNAVLSLLETDLSECKEGLQNGWCDETEVAKAQALIQEAKGRMAEVAGNDGEDDNGFDAFDLAMLM